MVDLEAKVIELGKTKLSRDEILQDYRWALRSRHASLIGRREVMGGKAKFGIFGDGKEVPQLAMAKAFKKGDFRSGYYRDQTFMFALGIHTAQEFFAQLYAHADVEAEPMSAGRSMTGHFATRSLDEAGNWKNLTESYNSSADVSPTGSQMPRLVGLAQASKLYRQLDDLHQFENFSKKGNEIAFGTIGNASCAEGLFWESVNAAGVLSVPMLLSVWDDDYGISVSNKYQLTKQNLSELLQGFKRKGRSKEGYNLYTVKGWDYPSLVETYTKAAASVRKEHIPAIIHVIELTQPQGHSTSGSHERYKSQERLQWENDHDCIKRMGEWMLEQELLSDADLEIIDSEERQNVADARDRAWKAYLEPIQKERSFVTGLIDEMNNNGTTSSELQNVRSQLAAIPYPLHRDILASANDALILTRNSESPARRELLDWKRRQLDEGGNRYGSYLYSASEKSALKIPEIKAEFSEKPEHLMGFDVLNACFDAAFARDPRVLAFGEDLGKLGDVNQGFKGMQEKYGELRVSDVGIREASIIGQAIGLAMRGLRPIAEIQYLDYLLYALQIMSDDLATVQWRTKAGQKAPAIIRTRGHRLEGVWHSGSPMSSIINLLRGIYVLVPRNMTQAAGFYNTMLRSDDAALIIEVLNGYRIREPLPKNIGEFTVPLGVPEILRDGRDVTLVTYGACCRITLEAAEKLAKVGVEPEVIDVQSLLPFDRNGVILESLKKTSRIVFIDEDVPGGGTAYMMCEVIEKQGGYHWLDSEPRTISSKEHRPAYGSDGDYFSKPNVEEIFEKVYEMMNEAYPAKFPLFM